ncbi:MAG: RHS repeat-associated core domain-containing protein, partial [Bacteroidales bacterium]
GTVQNLSYSFNPENGNLISRRDNLRNLQEIFSYDDLDRLTQVTGPSPMTMTYDLNGNIASKTSVGDYSYGTKPHAVTSVTNPDGLIDTTGQQITYTSFNKVESIIEGTARYTIQYGFANDRTLSKSYTNGVWQKKTYYVGNYEMDSIAGSSYPKNIHYIYGGDGIAAIYITQYSTSNMYYVHTDHLGSIDVMTNQSGTPGQYMSFDAWGRRRNHTDWTYINVPTSFLVSRGYTMHEHLDQFGLINMNGRVYDPILGRFLEPDNFVQAPGFSQAYNRYSYCWNNPLKYTDPSGYRTWWDNFKRWTKKKGDQFGDWQRKHNLDDVVVLVASLTNIYTGIPTLIALTASVIDGIANWDLSRMDPTNPGTKSNNRARITKGTFTRFDGNNLGEKLWDGAKRFTWEAPQTIVGNFSSNYINVVNNNVKSVNYYGGCTVIETKTDDWGGITLGNIIIGDDDIIDDNVGHIQTSNRLFQHEYGHYLQSGESGWNYYLKYGIPSLLDARNKSQYEHNKYWAEQDANKRALSYFLNKEPNYSGWDWANNAIFNPEGVPVQSLTPGKINRRYSN